MDKYLYIIQFSTFLIRGRLCDDICGVVGGSSAASLAQGVSLSADEVLEIFELGDDVLGLQRLFPSFLKSNMGLRSKEEVEKR